VLLLPEFLPDLVEDDAVVFSLNDLQGIVRTPRPRTLLTTRCSSSAKSGPGNARVPKHHLAVSLMDQPLGGEIKEVDRLCPEDN
jgi:hypothetical protein